MPILDYDLRDAFSTERTLLLYCGFYPNEGRMNKFLYYLSGFLHLAISLLIQLSLIVVIALHINSISTIAEALPFFVTQTAFLCKLICIITKREKFIVMERILSGPLFYDILGDSLRLVKSYINFTKRFAVLYRLSCFGVCATNGVFSLMGSHALVLGWNPWEMDNRTKYFINCAFQLVGLCVSAYLNSCIDILTYMLISVAAAQIEVVKANLTNIRYERGDAKKAFAKNVQLHCEILRLIAVIEEIFSNGILIQIFASVIVICFTEFQMLIVTQNTIQFISLLVYYVCMVSQVALYSWFGQYTITSSEKINQAIYMSNWYEADTSLKRSITIFMEKCKKPVILTAGNLFPLSLITFTTVIRSSFSYFTVLRRLYDKETNI